MSWLPWLIQIKAQYLIGDEIHYCCNPKAQRTRAMKALSKLIPNMVALSGTPLTNKPAELWPILNMLRPDLYPSFFPFGHRFCKPEKIFGRWVFKGANDLGILHRRLISTLMIRRNKEDVIDQLPKKRRIVVPLELNDPKEYIFAQENFLDWLGQTNPSKTSSHTKAAALTKTGYLKRLAAQLKMPVS